MNRERDRKRPQWMVPGLVLACLGTAGLQPVSCANRKAPTEEVTIYTIEDGLKVPSAVLHRARWTAAEVFAGIGVRVQWRGATANPDQMDADREILLQLDAAAPATAGPGVVARAIPYGRSWTRIHIFCDRVLSGSSEIAAGPYLGYVMAHEIAHVLQGISRHSGEGVMKAHWEPDDVYQMASRRLRFAEVDVELIHSALELRNTSHLASNKE